MSTALIEQLKRHEGFKGVPYRDSVGKLSIGYGHNLDAHPLSEDEATYLLVNDIDRHQLDLEREFPFVVGLDVVRKAALINMAFNMGVPTLCGFKRMWAAIKKKDWLDAGAEVLDSKYSKYSKQVGDRSIEIALMLAHGEWPAMSGVKKKGG